MTEAGPLILAFGWRTVSPMANPDAHGLLACPCCGNAPDALYPHCPGSKLCRWYVCGACRVLIDPKRGAWIEPLFPVPKNPAPPGALDPEPE